MPGRTGVFVEDLLAICAARLKSYQTGELPDRNNEDAITHIAAALGALEARTAERLRRGVEGSMKP